MRNRNSLNSALLGLGCVLAAACASAPEPAAETAAVAKGYILAEIQVTDPEPYKEYLAEVTPMVAAFGGAYIVRAGQAEAREGAEPAGRMVVLEFPSFAAAKAFYDSPEYAAIKHFRTDNAVSRILIVEGTAPPN
ncbi:MAG TPA: DUF1330 domain-containing protein [Hyphomonas sp.]|nr:DUF1330 domain-containing protein [Hyphomonas sp.]